MAHNIQFDDIPDRFKIDDKILENTWTKFYKDRYSITSGEITDNEKNILKSVCNEENFFNIDIRDSAKFTAFTQEAFTISSSAYDNYKIGSWSYGAILTLFNLATFIKKVDHSQESSFHILVRWKSQLLTAQIMPTTLWAIFAIFARWLVDFNYGEIIVSFLRQQEELLEDAIEKTRGVSNMNEWFLSIQDLSPILDSLYGIYWSLNKLIEQGDMGSEKIDAIPGFSANVRESEENRLEEMVAYLCSNGISYYSDLKNLSCSDYILGLIKFSSEKGKSVAIRQTQYDTARLWIPKFLSDEACKVLNGPIPAWVEHSQKNLGVSGDYAFHLLTFSGKYQRQLPSESVNESEESKFIASFGKENVTNLASVLKRIAEKQGVITQNELEPKIMLSPFLNEEGTAEAMGRFSMKFFKAKGIIKRDIPFASAVGYLMRLSKKGKREGNYAEEDIPMELLIPIKMGISNFSNKPIETLEMLDGIYNRYSDNPCEDDMSYFWGAVLAGVSLFLCKNSHKIALKYVNNLACNVPHEKALEGALAYSSKIEH